MIVRRSTFKPEGRQVNKVYEGQQRHTSLRNSDVTYQGPQRALSGTFSTSLTFLKVPNIDHKRALKWLENQPL